MAYWWQADLAPGSETTPDDLQGAGLDQRFDDQISAEEWLSLFYLDLQDLGVTQVSLIEADRVVYGPMPLAE